MLDDNTHMCSLELYDVLQKAWHSEPDDRSTLERLIYKLYDELSVEYAKVVKVNKGELVESAKSLNQSHPLNQHLWNKKRKQQMPGAALLQVLRIAPLNWQSEEPPARKVLLLSSIENTEWAAIKQVEARGVNVKNYLYVSVSYMKECVFKAFSKKAAASVAPSALLAREFREQKERFLIESSCNERINLTALLESEKNILSSLKPIYCRRAVR